MDKKTPKDWADLLQAQVKDGFKQADDYENDMLAKAHLIDAAPDMFEALKLIRALSGYFPSTNEGITALDAVSRAIARAGGK